MHILTQQMAAGQLNAASIAVWTVASLITSISSGALAGMLLGGKDLGNALAAAMGALYGPVAAVPGVLAGLMLLALL